MLEYNRIDINKIISASVLYVFTGTLNFNQKYVKAFLMKIITIITTNCFQKYGHINHINMLYYDRIDVSEGICVNKTSASKECIICP